VKRGGNTMAHLLGRLHPSEGDEILYGNDACLALLH